MRLESTIAIAVLAFGLGSAIQSRAGTAQKPPIAPKSPLAAKPKTRAELIRLVKSIEADFTKLGAHQKKMYSGYRALADKGIELSTASKKVAVLAEHGGSAQDQLLNATKQMQETQMSFNLQYLQLQSQMQHENRSYMMLSNIMKTKHETVKNSISNVR